MKHSIGELSSDIRSQIYSKSQSVAADSRTFTSTTQVPLATPGSNQREVDEIEQRHNIHIEVKKAKKKGYVQMHTNRGTLSLMLHCDMVPIGCDNFLRHATSGFYNGTKFHRLIPNFMMQGGDPTGTGRGGISAFNNGAPIPDEIDGRLHHDVAGIISYANAGKMNEIKSQFFITFAPCPHLDNKHTVFGKVVGGMSELLKLNTTPTTGADEPLDPIVIEKINVVEDPFASAVRSHEAGAEKAKRERQDAVYTKAARSDPMASHPNRHSMQIGKYIDWEAVGQLRDQETKRRRIRS